MSLLWEGLLTQLPSALITAAVAGAAAWAIRARARRRKTASVGEERG
ncbi:hypothetical protein ACFYVK_39695 [Streptomyces chartreusis]